MLQMVFHALFSLAPLPAFIQQIGGLNPGRLMNA